MRKIVIPPSDHTDLAETIGMAMRIARERGGYSFAGIDRALAMAIVAEAAQRTAITEDRPIEIMPPREAVLEILDLFFADLKAEATRALVGGMH